MSATTAAPRANTSAELGGRDALEHVLLGLLPVLITAWIVYRMYTNGIAAVDFRQSFWVAGWRTLHGLDPYSWTHGQISRGVSFPYPALSALLLAPFGLLSSSLDSIPITAAGVIAAPLSLWILGIRDWRVYGAVALWAPVVVAWQTANFTLSLVVGAALLWRFRERQRAAAVLVACLVLIKPIMVPLWIWLVFTRRWRTAALAAAIGIVLNAASWTVLGWHELSGWLSLLSLQGGLRDGVGYSLIALSTHLGLGRAVGDALIVLGGCLLAGIAAVLPKAGREQRLFGVAILLTIVVSPQVDAHYFAMLLVPLALTRPRLSWTWLAPLALWICPATRSNWWQIVVWWSLVATAGSVASLAGGERQDIEPVPPPQPA